MFSLIITIISIALVAALALATLYYGGDAFNQGRAGATASQLINEAQQVNAAVTLATANANLETGDTVAELQTKQYLSSAPQYFPAATLVDGANVTATMGITAFDEAVCVEVQKRALNDGSLTAADIGEVADVATQMYGCYKDAPTATSHTFFFTL